MTTAILYREELKEYDFGVGHPFREDRYQLFYQFLINKLPEENNYRVLQAEPATEQDLFLICEKDYIDFTRKYYGTAGTGSSPMDPNTIYPGTGFVHQIGDGEGKGFTVNIPMPVGAGNDSYELVFDSIVSPITSEFQPQIIIRNGGSDPHLYDDLTDLGLTIEGFRMIGERVRELSTICGDRVIDLIASGYDRQILPYE